MNLKEIEWEHELDRYVRIRPGADSFKVVKTIDFHKIPAIS